MKDSTKILISTIIVVIVIIIAIVIDKNQCNPTEMSEQLRQQIVKEEGI